ncbi:MAG: LCP family protein [Clostridia bacterium]|nr:LCP family protein [Clostridia bacterium]
MKRFICLLLCAALLMGCVPALADTPRDIITIPYEELPEPPAGQHHYLLCCTDTWTDDHAKLGNTDGVILVTLDTDAHRIIFTTLTREMLIKRPDGNIGRFTYIAKNYGPEEMCKIVSTHFGVKVDKYAIFCMDDIQNIIDAMGGVYITVTDAEADYLNRYRISRDSTTPSMDKAGTYLFGGHAAVIYMRIRKVGGDGDAGRTRRIRTVMSTLTDKYKDATLDDALALLNAITQYMPLTNMTMADMMEAVGYCMELRGVTPEGYQMPTDEAMDPITYAGMSTRQVDFEMARDQMQRILFPDDYID